MPEECSIIPASTPVVSFGNAHTARVATLGLNPSKREFMNADGVWLKGVARRLATLDSLGINSLETADDKDVEKIVADCYGYFHRNPYMSWFGPLEKILNQATDTSYMDGSACHLDLVQWATDPVWQKLGKDTRLQLLHYDREFLLKQLLQEHIGVVLLNGRSVINQVGDMGVLFAQKFDIPLHKTTTEVVIGSSMNTLFVGWSANLQSSFGVSNEFKYSLANCVKEQIARIRAIDS
jgi:hypothetical protein